jgi:hypothetical protein
LHLVITCNMVSYSRVVFETVQGTAAWNTPYYHQLALQSVPGSLPRLASELGRNFVTWNFLPSN